MKSRKIRFYYLAELESQRLNDGSAAPEIPKVDISPYKLLTQDTQSWLLFEQRPIFHQKQFNNDEESLKLANDTMTNATILARLKLFRGVHAKLSYGALTSMNQYYYHPEYCFSKRTEWMVRCFHIVLLQIQFFQLKFIEF